MDKNEIYILGHDWVMGQKYLSFFEVWFNSWIKFGLQEKSAWLTPAVFSGRGVSLDAEHYGEAHNAVTSCFARQTGSASSSMVGEI